MKKVNKVAAILAKANPHASTELEYKSDFELLLAVILSAQSTDRAVNIATRSLFADANTPQSVLNLGEDGLKKYIKNIGLYNNKAKHIIQTCRILIDKYAGRLPENFAEILTLPGVGRKTANVVMNVIFGCPTIAVDTHVFRVSLRLGIANGSTPYQVEQQLQATVNHKYKISLHNNLVLHGRYICKARQPNCKNCMLSELCNYYHDKNCS